MAKDIRVDIEISGPASTASQLSADYSDSETVDLLNPLSYTVISFEPFSPTVLGKHTVKVTISLDGDADPSNDVLNKDITVKDGLVDVWTARQPVRQR